MYGLTRGLTTLIGVAVAGGLIWLSSWMGPRDSMSEYWIAMGLIAAAGLALALSQLLGGWTKWGLPTVSPSVLALGFLPALVLGGWILIAAQPSGNQARENIAQWSSDVGIGGIVADVTPVVGAVAFALGLVFGLIFDTTGPRTREDVHERGRYVDEDRDLARDRARHDAGRRRSVEDEPVAAERAHAYDGSDRTYDETDTVERPAREPVGVGARDERATPSAPQPEPEAEPRRRSFFRR
jgi:hypothetical protein